MDNRLTALETKWDAVVPTLATKADLDKLTFATKADMSELRADFHEIAASVKTWAIASLIALLGFQTGLFAWFGRGAGPSAAPAPAALSEAGPDAGHGAGNAPTATISLVTSPLHTEETSP